MTTFPSLRTPLWHVLFLIALAGGLTACGQRESERRPADPSRAPDATVQAPSSAPPITDDAGTPVRRVRGQLLYVPSYSHIPFRDERRSLNLATTLSIRNTSRSDSLIINRVDYYDSAGALARHYLEAPVALAPLASAAYIVQEEDERGGAGANFLVQWTAAQSIDPPVVETVHITTQAALGISFTSEARVLSERH